LSFYKISKCNLTVSTNNLGKPSLRQIIQYQPQNFLYENVALKKCTIRSIVTK